MSVPLAGDDGAAWLIDIIYHKRRVDCQKLGSVTKL